ncbi:MAG: glycosyltransferase family 39 protein [Tannerella sp.]|jgi:4-amino-4-deoxy-L-arabinose transferase-like glycosyltransferase|nr:glycosyltransferase family 39 protein [Tannerella sp.]
MIMRTSALQYLYLQKPITTVILICAIALLPWLNSDFYTKGEPREASVAVSMIKSGNWILPEVYAGEFAYKPPMAHWLMAAFSLPQGFVSELTARLPSAVAQILLIGFVLVFFGKRIRFQEAFIATLLLLTCFEIHRAGMTARVDMLLTTFTVLGLMQLYRWENKLELKGLPLRLPLLFSCAILVKGPVGIILPSFVFFVYLLTLRKYSFAKILKSLLYICVSSLFLPMIWYAEAYRQGGEAFLNVLLAENFGRFFHLSESAITYDLGHKEGFFYNFITLLAGFIPWTILLVFSLFGAKWRLPHKSFPQILKDAWRRFQSMEKMKRFSLVAAVCILFFYTIPSSKRSVYLMPAYPFLSILLAQYFIYITENRSKVTRVFAFVLTAVASVIFLAGLFIMTRTVDLYALAGQYTTNASTLHAIESLTNAFSVSSITSPIIMGLLLIAIITVIYQTTKRINIKILYATILMTFCINLFVDGIIMRSIKNNTSARPFAEQISRQYDLKNNIYVMNNLREYGNLYGMNFYMGNTFRDFEREKPAEGYFLIIEKDLKKLMKQYGTQYQFEQLAISERQGDIRSQSVLLRFSK